MITLATLPQATEQEVFDQVARHLLTQKKRSRDVFNGKERCLYHSGTLKCAAGCLIADEEYTPDMETISWSMLIKQGMVPAEHRELIGRLQVLHDNDHPRDWRACLRQLAMRLGLSTEVLTTKKGNKT